MGNRVRPRLQSAGLMVFGLLQAALVVPAASAAAYGVCPQPAGRPPGPQSPPIPASPPGGQTGVQCAVGQVADAVSVGMTATTTAPGAPPSGSPGAGAQVVSQQPCHRQEVAIWELVLAWDDLPPLNLTAPDGSVHPFDPPGDRPWTEYWPYWRVCNGVFELRYRSRHLDIPPGFEDGQEGYLLIDSLRQSFRMPDVTIGISPLVDGLTGLETRYWVEGYDGTPVIFATQRFHDRIVQVRAEPSEYRWRFGDGAGGTYRTVGRPYPERSEIRHTYERTSGTSDLAQPDGTYLVRVRFVFDVTFRVIDPARPPGPGDGWTHLSELNPEWGRIERVADRSYRVFQVRSVLTR